MRTSLYGVSFTERYTFSYMTLYVRGICSHNIGVRVDIWPWHRFFDGNRVDEEYLLNTSMTHPEEFENFDPFPVAPRTSVVPAQSDETGEVQQPKKRQFTPVDPSKVEYWHQGEKAVASRSERFFRRKPHAKRADQFTMLLLVCSLVVLLFVLVAIYSNNRRYLFATAQPVETTTPVVDFYQGNHVFSEKVAEERAAKESGHPVHGITTVNDNLEVPISEQMSSMDDKMEKVRIEKEAPEQLPPTPDVGYKNVPVEVKPMNKENFQSPPDMNATLPKVLQTAK